MTIEITELPTCFSLKFPYSPTLVAAVKQLPGRMWDIGTQTWKVPLNCRVHLQRLVMEFAGVEEAKAQVTVELEPEDDVSPTCTKHTPWKHQLEGYRFIWNKDAALLHMDFGSGKSKIVVDYILNKPEVRKVLIVAPLSVIAVWPYQFEQHAGRPVLCVPLDENSGTVEQKADKARTGLADAKFQRKIAVVVVNYESFWRDAFAHFILQAKFDLVVYDECSALKGPGTKVSKFAYRLVGKIPVRLGLSATPCSHSPLDIYGIYRALDPTIFGTNFNRFRATYAIMGGFKNTKVEEFCNQATMRAHIDEIRFRVPPTGYDLPPVVHTDVILTMPEKARTVYTKLARDFVAGVGDGTIKVANAAVLLCRLQALASGFLPVESADGITTIRTLHTEKRDALVDLFNGLPEDEPVVVFARFRKDLQVIHEAAQIAGRKSSEQSGPVKTLEEWKSGATSVLAAQIHAASKGIDLTRANRTIYMSYSFSLEDYEQSEGRTRRANQKASTVYYHHLIMSNTVDLKMRSSLQNKKDVIAALLEGGIGE